MSIKIGNGELAPHLFELPFEEFKKAIPVVFRNSLLRGFPDQEEELKKVYLENGGEITFEKTETTDSSDTEVDSRMPERAGKGNRRAKQKSAKGGQTI
jgi:hypothetical protein